MSNEHFIKGACQQCAGHVEFPAHAAGETQPCPHCGQPTQLVAPPQGEKTPLWMVAVVSVLAGILALLAILMFTGKTGFPSPSNKNASSPAQGTPDSPPDEIQTNGFGISGVQLEKTPDSSLVSVTGTVRNLRPQQRFGVKIEFSIFDTDDQPAGSAKDYRTLLEPGGQWQFKALVLGSKAATARLNSIVADQE